MMEPAAKCIVLHIGVHKTGTSSIQQYLGSNAQALEERGVLYPHTGRRTNSGRQVTSHYELAWAVVSRYAQRKGRSLNPALWRELRVEIEESPCRLAVLSSEFFWLAKPEEVASVRAAFGSYDVRIVLYTRNILAYALSSYKEGIKGGTQTKSLGAYLQDNLWRFDYAATADKWADVFGKDNVVVRCYDKVKATLLEDFACAAGFIMPPQSKQEVAVNISPSDGAIRLIRLLNRIEVEMAGRRISAVHRLHRNIEQGRMPGVALTRLTDAVLRRPILREKHLSLLRAETAEMRSRFLLSYIAPEDHHFYDF